MAALVILDSGVFLAVTLNERYREQAVNLIRYIRETRTQITGPLLFRYEFVSVIRKAVFQQRLTSEEATKGLNELLTMPIQFHLDNALLVRAYELATQFNRPTAYDSQYLALAERLGCDFWTADEKLFNTTHAALTWVKWVGNFTPTDSTES